MLQTKFMLSAVVALMGVSSAIAIIGGQDAVRGRFSYFAYLKCYQIKSSIDWISPYNFHTCGGALISKKWVLTAAQCLVNIDGAQVFLDIGDLNDSNEIGRETFNVTKGDFVIHPSYTKDQPFVNDVALIKLPLSEKHSEYIHTARLSCVPTPIGSDAITMGFGRVSATDNIFATTLQYTELKTIDLEECVPNALDFHTLTDATNSFICANGSTTSLCTGDKGAPLVSIKTGKLIGMANYADANCTLGSPHGFTGIRSYIQWIEGVIGKYICKNQVKLH